MLDSRLYIYFIFFTVRGRQPLLTAALAVSYLRVHIRFPNETMIRSVTTYVCPTWACGGRSHLEIAEPAEQSSPRYWKS
jgi:hypothetical protein